MTHPGSSTKNNLATMVDNISLFSNIHLYFLQCRQFIGSWIISALMYFGSQPIYFFYLVEVILTSTVGCSFMINCKKNGSSV